MGRMVSKSRRKFITVNRSGTPLFPKDKWIVAIFCIVGLLIPTLFVGFLGYPLYLYQYNKHHNYAITCTVKDSKHETIGALYSPNRLVVESEDCEDFYMSRSIDGTTQPQALNELKPGRRVQFYIGEKKVGGLLYFIKYKILSR